MFSRAQMARREHVSSPVDVTVKAGIPYVSPDWDHVMGHKHGTITDEQYTIWYITRLDAHREEVLEWARALPEDATFLCYCPIGAFCHTYLLVDWLAENM